MEYCLGSITLEVLWHINSFLKQCTGSTGILLSAGLKMKAVNPLRSKRYSVTSKNPLKVRSAEVPTREELQVSLQVNIGPNYMKREIVIGEYL